MRFCDECGAPVTERMIFCERCGAFVGDDDGEAPREVTQRMPNPNRRERARQPHQAIQHPIPIMDAPRGAERQGNGSQQSPNRGDRNKRTSGNGGRNGNGSNASGAVGWALAGVLAVAMAILIGYVIGISGQSQKNPEHEGSAVGSDEVQWSTEDKATDDGQGSTDETAHKTDTDSEGKPTARKEEPSVSDSSEAGSGGEEPGNEKPRDASDGTEASDEKDEESEEMRRMRESVSEEMRLRPDGQLLLSVSVPTDNKGLSERIEVSQGGKVVYSSRILSPGETLDWVPADGAHAGSAKVTVYGILEDKDYGGPITIEAEVIEES